MNNALDLFLGDPIYDKQKNVIRRDFGVKNIVSIMVVGFIGYSLMGEIKPKSGKRKMKGGSTPVVEFSDADIRRLSQRAAESKGGSAGVYIFVVGLFATVMLIVVLAIMKK